MNAKPIIFRQGEENGIVIERKDFENSIFVNQYNQAIEIFNRLWSQQEQRRKNLVGKKSISIPVVDNQYSNIISFCGDRGEGKTSCMSSFATILAENEVRKEAKKTLSFPKNKDNEDLLLSPEMIDWLDVIDPSFFDEDHNLLELLLGRMYYKVQRLQKSRDNEDSCNCACTHRELMEQFQKVKKSISTMTPQKDKKIYDTIEDISDLAAGMRLREEIEKLFMCYLQYAGKECLLICIDDLDLNISQGYKMAEMLRKYLINPYCIILVSVKIEQLIDIIATAHKQEVKNTGLAWSYCMNMAQKYVAKLLPRGNQVPMPSAEDICERKIQIAEINEKEDKIGLKDLTVKERVVQLIFQKTGYVFYNGQYLSPIVPTNLRSLRHLISTLETLPDARNEDGSDNETGREVFKNYFFGTWAARLESGDYEFAQQLANYSNLSTLNAFVVEYLAKRLKKEKIEIKIPEDNPKKPNGKNKEEVKKEENTNAEETDSKELNVELDKEYSQLYLNITNRTNTSTNISLGDALYVLWLIGNITVNEDISNLIFFIRTVYSIRLYECYNEITTGDEALFPFIEDINSQINIHKADSLYNGVNRIQRLVNGSYFTYPQGLILANGKDRFIIEDSKTKVSDLFQKLYTQYQLPKSKRSIYYSDILKMCELIALYSTYASTKENVNKDNYIRESKIPTFLGTFTNSPKNIVMDFLNPFYALCNIQYTYNRFDELLTDNESDNLSNDNVGILYRIADSAEKEGYESLLSKFKEIRQGQYEDGWDKHGFVSDSVIRVIDVQTAIFDELIRLNRKHRKGAQLTKIRLAYKDIIDLKINLFPKIEVSDNKIANNPDRHTIRFKFLEVISNFLSDCENNGIEDTINEILTTEEPKEEEKQRVKQLICKVLDETEYPVIKNELCKKISASTDLTLYNKSKLTTKQTDVIFKKLEKFDNKDVVTDSQIDSIVKWYFKYHS